METLDELIASYGENNSKFTSMKKICEDEKAKIKNLMGEAGLSERTVGGWKVTYIVSERESLDEARLLHILQEDWVTRYGSVPCPYIKTREYVDMDVLESVLYAGELPDSVLLALDGCRNITEVITLKCSKVKKKEDK